MCRWILEETGHNRSLPLLCFSCCSYSLNLIGCVTISWHINKSSYKNILHILEWQNYYPKWQFLHEFWHFGALIVISAAKKNTRLAVGLFPHQSGASYNGVFIDFLLPDGYQAPSSYSEPYISTVFSLSTPLLFMPKVLPQSMCEHRIFLTFMVGVLYVFFIIYPPDYFW